MRLIISILAIAAAILAILVTGQYYFGLLSGSFEGPQGMAILAFQLFGMIASAAALLFGFIGRIMDRRAPRPASKWTNAAIAVGLICGLLFFASPFVFG